MSDQTPWRIILAAEGPSDQQRISCSLDHFIRSRSDIQVPLDAIRQFDQFDQNLYLPIKTIPDLARKVGLPRYNNFGDGDKGTLRKLYQVLQKKKLLTPKTVILWARDEDGYKVRREHAKEARDSLSATTTTRIVLAIASQCGEAWVVAGFTPSTSGDIKKAQYWRKELGFTPHEHPERLSHKENVPKSAKDIMQDLFDGDAERETHALISAATSKSIASAECGLLAFCKEIEDWLAQASEFNTLDRRQ